MTRPISTTPSSRRARLLRAGLAACVAGGALTVSSPTQAAIYDYIESCTASFSPDRIVGSETAQLTFTFNGGNTVSVAGVDANGAVVFVVGLNQPAVNYDGGGYPADFLQNSYFGGVPGLGGLAFFGSGDTTGTPLCVASVIVNDRTAPSFTTEATLPAGKVGVPYASPVLGDPGDYTDVACTLEGTLPAGLSVVPPAAAITPGGTLDCGTVTGTPNSPGTYTLTGTITYGTTSDLTIEAASEPITQEFTIVIADADPAPTPVDTPRYTG